MPSPTPPSQPPQQKSAATSSGGNIAENDADEEYDPTAEALVNDFDDERTLDEEEDMQDEDETRDEINDLQKDAEVPLDELLAYYSYCQQQAGSSVTGASSSSGDVNDESDDDDVDDEQYDEEEDDADYDGENPNQDDDDDENQDDDDDDDMGWRRLIKIGPEHQAIVADELCHYSDVPAYENQDLLMWTSGDLSDEQVDAYLRAASSISRQAQSLLSGSQPLAPGNIVPSCSSQESGISTSSDSALVPSSSQDPIQESHEVVVSVVNQNIIESSSLFQDDLYMTQSRKQQFAYLKHQHKQQVHNPENKSDTSVPLKPSNGHGVDADEEKQQLIDSVKSVQNDLIQDEDQLLYLLLQCNHNIDEALRRRALDPLKYYIYEPMSPWSDEECAGFERGLRQYGKNFHLVARNEMTTRKISEIIHFYYIWKKSERHDMYVNQYNFPPQVASTTNFGPTSAAGLPVGTPSSISQTVPVNDVASLSEHPQQQRQKSSRPSGEQAGIMDFMDKFVDCTNEMLSSHQLSSGGNYYNQHQSLDTIQVPIQSNIGPSFGATNDGNGLQQVCGIPDQNVFGSATINAMTTSSNQYANYDSQFQNRLLPQVAPIMDIPVHMPIQVPVSMPVQIPMEVPMEMTQLRTDPTSIQQNHLDLTQEFATSKFNENIGAYGEATHLPASVQAAPGAGAICDDQYSNVMNMDNSSTANTYHHQHHQP